MPTALATPDLAISLPLDADAARAARYYVCQVDRPSPDLRDAVVLLTSELVTRAVERCQFTGATMELRVWMPSEIVRVEVRAPRTFLGVSADDAEPSYRLLVFGRLADRWSSHADGTVACLWFEIDRHASSGETSTATEGRESARSVRGRGRAVASTQTPRGLLDSRRT
jgi:hypothetical protein